MAEHITKSELTDALAAQQTSIQAYLHTEIRDLVEHFNRSESAQNQRFDRIDASLEEVSTRVSAIMAMLTTRQEVRALVRELQAQGIELDEKRIFHAA